MSNPAKLLFLGLPHSGKTTFLAALWHVLSDGNASTALRMTRMSGDRAYLNQITTEWRQCSLVPRTNLQTDQVVVLHIEREGADDFDLSIPDLAGEAFKQQLLDRRISLQHDNFVSEATGVMLFIHPDVKKSPQLTVARQLQRSLGGATDDTSKGDLTPVAWAPEMLPHAVQLVELLQFLLDRMQRKLRLVVVVSAWDLVDDLAMTPQTFIAKQLPLLHQFLTANDDLIEHSVFGVSAQGGDITIASEKQSLLAVDDALKRIKVQYGDDIGQDITKPIAWLLERE